MFKIFSQIFYSLYPKNRSKTVRKAFPLMFFAVLLLSAAAVITQEQSYITIETPTTVKEGQTFFMTVTATANVAVNAIDVVIEYPDTQIEITSIDTGTSVITLWTEDPYFEAGKIYLRGGTFGQGFIGEHDIARIRAVAIESGTAYVITNSVKFIAGDGEGTEVAVGDKNTEKTKIYITNTDGSLVGTASVKIVTDVDGDGDVDITDISSFMASWFNRDTFFDFNGDGKMNFRDFSILLADSFFN